MSKLIDLFDGLSSPELERNGSIFSAIRLEGALERHLCKDASGRPLILIAVQQEKSRKAPNYALEHLRIDHDVRCRIAEGNDKPQAGRFTILHCLSSDRDIQEYFLRVVEMLLDSLPESAGMDEIVEAIDKLIALFRAMRNPSRLSVHGLWAELFMITRSIDPLFLLKAWHSEATDEVDFSNGVDRLELKCSASGTRRHHFTLGQLTPPEGTHQIIASMLIESTAGGVALRDLWEEARSIAAGDPDLLLKIEKACAGTLGEDWQDSRDWTYDEHRAKESLQFFDPSQIPSVPSELPQGVSDVRFLSDLSFAQPMQSQSLSSRGGLFAACLIGEN